ncbi:hypothetical protein FKW77_001103 [Venturia effusa]|uniref:Nickel/cobalt efflux system n=1 Tax=Venturia effusa TaxID=50376 RepID=A0A517LGH5_9PEZI|nr:hypothetical protein FKW77_001103 [Venturia effusa]
MDTAEDVEPWTRRLHSKASRIHSKVPFVNKLSFSAVAIIVLLVLINVAAWIIAIIALRVHPGLMSTAALAYILGLRHALDADHISVGNRSDDQKTVGVRTEACDSRDVLLTWPFNVGTKSVRREEKSDIKYSIVIVTSIVVAATAASVSKRFDNFSHIGGIIGSSVSAAFLLLLGIMNIYILVKLVQQLRVLIQTPLGQEVPFKIEGGGVLLNLFKKMFTLIDRPWKMYPLGVLFGLGFDTSSEIALLGISSIQSARGTSLWLILIFPLLFTAGMCLLDTTDGALMMNLYSSTTLARDQIAVCYYSFCLTAITVVVAILIGVVQLLILGSKLVSEEEGEKRFWKGIDALGERYDIVGASICGAFVFFGVLSVLIYKPWRRQVDRRRARLAVGENSVLEDEIDMADGDIIAGASSPGAERVEGVKVQISRKNFIIKDKQEEYRVLKSKYCQSWADDRSVLHFLLLITDEEIQLEDTVPGTSSPPSDACKQKIQLILLTKTVRSYIWFLVHFATTLAAVRKDVSLPDPRHLRFPKHAAAGVLIQLCKQDPSS